VGGGRMNGGNEGGRIWLMYFVYLYEKCNNEIHSSCFKKAGGKLREKDGGVSLIKVYCKYIWKCHNETPVQLIYADKNV
jgi:hypothetical protein